MGTDRTARKQDRQQPYNGQPVEQAAPVVAWPTDEARQTVIATNQASWRTHATKAQGHRANASRLNADLAELNRQYAELGRIIKERGDELAREQHYDKQEQATADGYAAALAALGAPVSDDVLVHPLQTAQGDPDRHAAAFGGPTPDPLLDPFGENKPDGHCVYCGKPAWRTAVTERAPHGATHGFGPTCEPNNRMSPAARLSDELTATGAAS